MPHPFVLTNFVQSTFESKSCVDIERLFKMSARQRSQTMRQVCRRLEEETNVTKIYIIH